jgi:hypothetical protein
VLDDAACLHGINSERLVHHYRNSGLDARQRTRCVLIVRRGDDCEIESAGVEHRVEAGVYGHSRVVGGGLGLPLRVSGHHRCDPHFRLGADQLPMECPTGQAVPDDPDSKLACQGINLLV